MPSRALTRTALVAALVATGAVGAVTTAAPSGAAPAAFQVRSLHFLVHVGPDRSTACDVVGDLYTPRRASSTHKVPAVLTTNGFGGSKDDQQPFAAQYAANGYAVLSYSGLGFGGSGCPITLDDPEYDGVAGSQLVSFLGGAPGIAFTDAAHTQPVAPLDVVVHDVIDHAGRAQAHDPRVGMWGGSYGGQVQFAVAGVDPRVDALVPQITWNDLSYSLDPNNTAQTSGVTTSTPGATKSTWAALFSTLGIFDGVQYSSADPQRLVGCPNFATFVCPALVAGGVTGFLPAAAVTSLQHASVSTYVDRITVPTLLVQGEVDTLFNLNEASATYAALKAQGTPVSLLWRYNGHSGGTPSAAGASYEARRIANWFGRYLKGETVGTGPAFAYYRDWDGQVATAGAYPVGTARNFFLSGSDLVTTRAAVTTGAQTFVTPPAGAPTTLGNLDALGSVAPTELDLPNVDVPGTFARWQSPALTAPLTVVGAPTLDVTVSAPVAAAAQATGPAGQLVLVAKVYDVAPDGTASTVNGLVAPVRVPDVTCPVHVTLPAFAHRFAPGHRLAVVLAGGDVNYRSGLVAQPVTISTAPGSAQRLTLPVVPST